MFKPKRVLFEKGTLDTEVGQNIYNMIKDDKNIEVIKLTSNKIKGIYLEKIYLNSIEKEKKQW